MSDWIDDPISRASLLKRVGAVAGGLYLTSPALDALAAGGAAPIVIKPIKTTTKKASQLKFRFMNQIDGVPYYQRAAVGMKAAAKDLGIGDARMTGPPRVDGSLQVGTVESWITQKVDVIAVSSTDAQGMTPTINKAIAKGITVLSWNVDAPDSKRLLYVDDWDPVRGPQALWEVFMKRLGSRRGEYAVITTAFTSGTHKGWVDAMVAYQKAKYPTMRMVDEQENLGDQTVADQKAKAIIQAHPNLLGLVSVDAGGTVGIAQATVELGVTDKVFTTGLSTPSQMKQFVSSGVVPEFVLWDPALACYLATVIGYNLIHGKRITSGERLHVSSKITRRIQITPIPGHGKSYDTPAGNAIVFNKANIDSYSF